METTKSLRFNRLILLSDSLRSANQFRFHERYNLITGKDNGIGKSTLVKSIFWTLGCEPRLDITWKSLDVKAFVEFSIGNDNYKVLRFKNIIFWQMNNEKMRIFNKITGEYSELFSSVVNFKVLLPNNYKATELETPPPAFYFLPFYIDQRKSWSELWDSFENIGQYRNSKKTIIKYHAGYLKPHHFEIEKNLVASKIKAQNACEIIRKIDSAINVFKNYSPSSSIVLDENEYNVIIDEIQNDLQVLQKREEALFHDFQLLQTEKQHLESQLVLAEVAVSELEADYKFSVEYINGDMLECPLCGTKHDNSLLNRTSILADKQKTDDIVAELRSELKEIDIKIENVNKEISEVREEISEINNKYNIKAHPENSKLANAVNKIALGVVTNNVSGIKNNNIIESNKQAGIQKDLKKAQKKLISRRTKNDLDKSFQLFLVKYINLINSDRTNLEFIRTPLDYKKLYGNGGAADSTRAILAYQVAILHLIKQFGCEIVAPFVVDTPNQHEQAIHNYDRIINLLLHEIPDDIQLFLCAMESPYLDEFKSKANVINLDNDKLLKKDFYEGLKREIEPILLNLSNEELHVSGE